MIKNEILLKRICQLIAQTHAVSLENVFKDAKQIGIERVIELLENQNTPKFN
jgi:hypothetical protein